MRGKRDGRSGLCCLAMAAALAAGAPVNVLAASPEFARTAEEWATIRDNTLEYGEIPDLIHEYNSTVQNNLVSYEDYKGKDANEIANDYRDAAEELYASIEWPPCSTPPRSRPRPRPSRWRRWPTTTFPTA